MSFVEQEDILDITERLMVALIKEVFPSKKITEVPFPRISHAEAIKKYGNDKPDLRKNKKDADELAFCWVLDFPLFEATSESEDFNPGHGEWTPSHHMFTM